jgi:hypothetical protein
VTGEALPYAIPGSHPARTGQLMLEQKGMPFQRVDLVPGFHRVHQRWATLRSAGMRVALLAATAASLMVCAIPAGAAPRQVPHGFHGVTWDRDVSEAGAVVQRAHARMMARSGVESMRTVFNWAMAQPTGPQTTDFSRTDEVVAHAARRRIDLLPIVMYTPPWAQLTPGVSPPARPSDYAAYLGQLVDRYGRGGTFWRERPKLPRRPVRNWQIWNEPNLEWQWSAPNWVEGYVDLLRHAYPAVKQRDRRARVVLAGLVIASWEELERVYGGGGGPYFDVAATHMYSSTPDWSLEIVRRSRQVMDAAGDRQKPIWATEVSWPAAKDRLGEDVGFIEVDDRGMARNLTRFYGAAARERKRLRLERVFWYTWASGYEPGRDRFEYSGLVTYTEDGRTQRRPALRAFARSARRLQGCVKTARGTCRRGGRRSG